MYIATYCSLEKITQSHYSLEDQQIITCLTQQEVGSVCVSAGRYQFFNIRCTIITIQLNIDYKLVVQCTCITIIAEFLNDLQILARSMSIFEDLRDDLFVVTTFIGDNIAGYKNTTI